MLKRIKYTLAAVCFLFNCSVLADITIPMTLTTKQGLGKAIGTITAKETAKGVIFTPNLHGLPPGFHGFHIHQNPSCLDEGKAAGDHFDPQHTNHHLGPYEKGHLGDLPALQVNNDGNATITMLAPRLHLNNLKKHSLIIHAGGDNYSDIPQHLGGGGSRIACGVIK
ncbi:MAG: superoxide dismutase [Cu-Zn] SodC [Rickettsiella sp.]|nr:superoxide dismutase [Cu-Zn] SodC [Rickettsiella sp.]